MSIDSTYSIDFHSLKAVGEGYDYEFPIDNRFFERWSESEVSKGSGVAKISLLKHASMMELEVLIEAEVTLVCDRCLDEFQFMAHFEGNPVVKISNDIPDQEEYSGATGEGDENNSDGDVLWISPSADALDLGQYIYESIILSLPFQRVHPQIDECNDDMLSRFQIVTEDEFESTFDEELGTGDGRINPFAVLEGLKGDYEKKK